jgi:hypothetical protein
VLSSLCLILLSHISAYSTQTRECFLTFCFSCSGWVIFIFYCRCLPFSLTVSRFVASSVFPVTVFRSSNLQRNLYHNLLCCRMVKHYRAALSERLSPRPIRRKYLKPKDKWLKSAPALSKTSGPENFPNRKLPYCSSKPFPSKTRMKTSSYPHMDHTSTCSTILSATNEEMSRELMSSTSKLQDSQQKDETVTILTSQSKVPLLNRLSDRDPHCQTMKMADMSEELALTSTPCLGARPKTRTVSYHRTYPRHFKKPMLCSRISLAMSNEPDLHSSTVTNQFRNSPKLSGSTYSTAMPWTSTMSSQTSTQSPMLQAMSSNSGKTSSCTTVPLYQPKQSKPMETGLLHGTVSLKQPCSSSSTENRSCKLMANTFNDTSPPCLPNSIAVSSAMTGQSVSGQLNDEISNSPISLNSPIYRSNGSITLRTLPLVKHQNQSPNRMRTVDEALRVEDGMKIVAQTPPQTATTYMYAQNAPTLATSQAIATPQTRNKRPFPNLRWERRPRFVRDFVWSDDYSQDITTALTSETSPPVPEPPRNELLNADKWNVINSQPHLFRISTPVKVDRLYQLLTTHPNRPLVESICKGLKIGFWPWAITHDLDAPSIVDNANLQKIVNPDHLRFMMEQRDEEIELGHFSVAFETLLPGMTTIPLWVVPKPHSDNLRLVVDHSAGNFSPNSYISSDDASVHLDTLRLLGKALIKLRMHHGNVPIVLFKTDVSQAYRRLPMHPLWQLRQVVTIDGSHHVDNNNNFGNRGAGRLWVTFFSLVLWIAIVILHIHDLFAYVDDAFSWEFASNVTFYPPYKKFLPTKQAKLLTLFDEVGVPHNERKQVSGSPLQIIGFDVDPNAMSITMPLDARNELITAIRTFANPRQRRSLRDFQRLAGWVNWALNVYPLLRPGLSSIYEKMRRGSFPFQKLSVNNTICNELHWLTSLMVFKLLNLESGPDRKRMTHSFVTPAPQAWDTGHRKPVRVSYALFLPPLKMEFSSSKH